MDDYTSLQKQREHDFHTRGVTKHKQQMSTGPFLPPISSERSCCEHKTWRSWEAVAMPSAPLISLRVVHSENRKQDHSSNSASLLGKILVLLIHWGFSLFLFPATVDSYLHKSLCYWLWQIVKTKIQNHTA